MVFDALSLVIINQNARKTTDMNEPHILFPVPISELKTLIYETVSECLAAAADSKSADSLEGFISREEAADLLHISYQTLAKRTQGGEFVAYRVGTRVLYKRAELIAALTPTNRYTVPGNKRGPKPKLRAAA